MYYTRMFVTHVVCHHYSLLFDMRVNWQLLIIAFHTCRGIIILHCMLGNSTNIYSTKQLITNSWYITSCEWNHPSMMPNKAYPIISLIIFLYEAKELLTSTQWRHTISMEVHPIAHFVNCYWGMKRVKLMHFHEFVFSADKFLLWIQCFCSFKSLRILTLRMAKWKKRVNRLGY